jgi:hypothetical protein
MMVVVPMSAPTIEQNDLLVEKEEKQKKEKHQKTKNEPNQANTERNKR